MKHFVALFFYGICFVFAMSSCGPSATPGNAVALPTQVSAAEKGDQTMAFEITSPAFAPGEHIPTKYTCDGEDISPPLHWSDPPDGTRSFALISDDPDAPVGTWVHWVLFNLPAKTRDLPEQADPPAGSQDGQNSWKRLGYGGPCPPSGTHRYFFKLYALDTVLNLAAGANKEQLLQAMEGHILGQTEVMGVYSRQ
jgi:Raf kinase inhibitor-like YbhB/YbcL family protein